MPAAYKRTDPGSRRKQIVIQRMVSSSPPVMDAGGPVLAPSVVLRTSASIRGLRPSDPFHNGQTTPQLYLVINIRYRVEVLPNMQVVAPHGTYVIQAIDNLEQRDEEQNLYCIALGSTNQ